MVTIFSDNTIITMNCKNTAVKTINSGETVTFETLDCFGNTIQNEDQKLSSVGWQDINPATGPLYVNGAEIGDTLKVEILDIIISDHGVISTAPDLGVFGEYIKDENTKIVPIKDNMVIFNDKISFPIKPMIGVIGTAPENDQDIPTGSPGFHGGNMDCNKIIKGSTLYLPVFHPGALLSMGDVHAIMGDGEVCVCGVEIGASVTVKVTVIKNSTLPTPFLVSEGKAMTIYSANTIDEAAKGATLNMHKFVQSATSLTYADVMMLLSVSADLAICQMVDPLMTVRMELPIWILEKYKYKFD